MLALVSGFYWPWGLARRARASSGTMPELFRSFMARERPGIILESFWPRLFETTCLGTTFVDEILIRYFCFETDLYKMSIVLSMLSRVLKSMLVWRLYIWEWFYINLRTHLERTFYTKLYFLPLASGWCLSLRLGFTSYIRPHRFALTLLA